SGATYDVLELSPDGSWVRLRVPGLDVGASGWASTNFVSLEGEFGQLPQEAGVFGVAVISTLGARLRVRAQPSEASATIGYVRNRTSYAILEFSQDGKWVRIGVPEGLNEGDSGWIALEFVTIRMGQ
ncbi:MAG: SH3 domain-containing protein, partial [Caldilineaceae bacterium]|nr:SH3 domain-containing protein [Caldilineaceae bacterium]